MALNKNLFGASLYQIWHLLYGFSNVVWLIKLTFDFHKQERNKLLLSILILLFFRLKLSFKMLKIVDYGSCYIPVELIESKKMILRNVSKFYDSSWEIYPWIIAASNYLKRLRILSRH